VLVRERGVLEEAVLENKCSVITEESNSSQTAASQTKVCIKIKETGAFYLLKAKARTQLIRPTSKKRRDPSRVPEQQDT
jgi:hypothetical protein